MRNARRMRLTKKGSTSRVRLMKKLKKHLKYVSSGVGRTAVYYAANYDRVAVDENMVVYESRDGQSATDSPRAIFEYLYKSADFQHLTHIWIADKKVITTVKQDLPKSKNVIVVERNTINYAKILLKAKYLVNNSTFNYFFLKKSNQVYVNTWHGTPIKNMGFDIPGPAAQNKNVLRNFLMADYLIAQNDTMVEMYAKQYKLDGLYQGEILKVGLPRTDMMFKNSQMVRDALAKNGQTLDTKRPNILYAPTWKGTKVAKPLDEIDELYHVVQEMRQQLPTTQVWLKVHPYVYESAKQDQRLTKILLPDNLDANFLMAAMDVLITDYSSIFIDFIATGRPTYFLRLNNTDYEGERGLNKMAQALEVPIANTVADLVTLIKQNTTYDNDVLHRKLTPYDDGSVTEKLISYLLKKEMPFAEDQIITLNHQKTKILMMAGGMRNNGITTSAINFSRTLDYNKFDLTILMPDGCKKDALANMALFDQHARLMYAVGRSSLSLKEGVKNWLLTMFSKDKIRNSWVPERAYQRDALRLTAGQHFDYAIDYSGYSFRNGRWIFKAQADKKYLLLHNDMWESIHAWVRGKQPHIRTTGLYLKFFNRYDRVFTVSEYTRQINQQKLANYVGNDQWGVLHNAVSVKKAVVEQVEPNFSGKWLETNEFEQQLALLMSDTSKIYNGVAVFDVESSHVAKPVTGTYRLSTMGRLVPEKNQLALIQAVAALNEKSTLQIHLDIIGDGVLADVLYSYVANHQLESQITFWGYQTHSETIVSQTDLFVLPSLFEGQPMVLLETLGMGIPVLATNIISNADVLKDGDLGTLTNGVTPEQLATGITKALYQNQQNNSGQSFNLAGYNAGVKRDIESIFS